MTSPRINENPRFQTECSHIQGAVTGLEVPFEFRILHAAQLVFVAHFAPHGRAADGFLIEICDTVEGEVIKKA